MAVRVRMRSLTRGQAAARAGELNTASHLLAQIPPIFTEQDSQLRIKQDAEKWI